MVMGEIDVRVHLHGRLILIEHVQQLVEAGRDLGLYIVLIGIHTEQRPLFLILTVLAQNLQIPRPVILKLVQL
jgi:hypothetical protein